MHRLLFLLFLSLSFHAFCQKGVVEASAKLIVARKYNEANRYLDSVLKKDKKSVDALMMKGNVALNAALDSSADKVLWFDVNEESIFSEEVTERDKVVYDKRTVKTVAGYWNKCLLRDPKRTDIMKGLCSLYSMAGDTAALRQQIVRLKKAEQEDDGQVFRMAEYARKVYAPLGFQAKMDLYHFIAGLYPASAGIRCDIASEYFYQGEFNKCFAWLDSCAQFQSIDETSFLNGAFIYSQLGYFDNASLWLQRYDSTFNRSMNQFYSGLMLYADNGNIELLKNFSASADSNVYFEEYNLARKLTLHGRTMTFNESMDLLTGSTAEWYKPFLYIRAMKTFPERCEPILLYGVYQSKLKNYSSAVQFLAEGNECKLQGEQAEYWLLNYGYVLFRLNKPEDALSYFKSLQSSKNEFYKQAAAYFSIVSTKDNGQKARLKTMLSSATKFAGLLQAREGK